jgi:hypothetical protein
VLNVKIIINYINIIISFDILILPSLTSSSRIGFSSEYLIPVRALNLLRSILPSLLVSIQRIRSRGACEIFAISIALFGLDSNSYSIYKKLKLMDTSDYMAIFPDSGTPLPPGSSGIQYL